MLLILINSRFEPFVQPFYSQVIRNLEKMPAPSAAIPLSLLLFCSGKNLLDDVLGTKHPSTCPLQLWSLAHKFRLTL